MFSKQYSLEGYVRAYDQYQEYREGMKVSGAEIAREARARSQLSMRRYAASLGVTAGLLSKVEKGLDVLPPEVARRMISRCKASG